MSTGGKIAAAVVGGSAVFFVSNRIVEYVRLELAKGTAIGDLLDGLTPALTGNLLHLSTAKPDLLGGAIGVVIMLLIIFYVISSKQNTRPGEEQGSAKWAKSGRMPKQFTSKEASQVLRLTMTEALSVDSYKTKRNTNVLVLGASGTGKTRSYILPNLGELEASTATTDPKGEIIRAVRGPLEERGYKIRTLNLINLKQSHKFNPLRYFNPDEIETGIMQLVESIMMNTTGKESTGDQFFERAEKALLTALVAYEWATTYVTESQEPNLPGVLDLQKGMDGSEEDKDARDSETDIKFQAAREIVAEWQMSQDSDDDEQVMKVLDFACRLYRVYEQGAVETRKSIVISLGVRLSPLDMHDIRDILSTDDLALDKIGYEPTALFLQIPDTHSTFKFVAAMFWQCMFEQTVYQADHEESGRLPRMLHMFLDEFANIGKLPEFDKKMATIRSRGISASIVMQSYSQGKALFKDEWDGIVGNCDTTLFLGTNDQATAEWMSKRLGNETVISQDTSRSYGGTGSWSKSNRTMKRPLMEPDEVGGLADELAIVKIRGLHPFMSRKLGA